MSKNSMGFFQQCIIQSFRNHFRSNRFILRQYVVVEEFHVVELVVELLQPVRIGDSCLVSVIFGLCSFFGGGELNFAQIGPKPIGTAKQRL